MAQRLSEACVLDASILSDFYVKFDARSDGADDDSLDDLEDDRSFHQLRTEFQTYADTEGHTVFVVQPDYQLNEKEMLQLGIGDRR